MFTFCVLASVTAAAGSVPMAFLFPDQLEDASNVVLAPRFPESTAVLVAADPSRPKLWYSPAAVWSGDGEDLVWYQRVDKGEKEYMDQRVLCAAWIRNGEWSLPALRPGSPVWGGPDNVAMRRSPHKPTWGGFNVFQIVREGDRFRMLYWDQPATGEAGAMLAESADGLSWTTDARGTVFVEHNDAFTLLPKDGAYLLYQTKLEDWPDKPYADNLDKMRRVQTIR
ncbi:MAG: hypothetical protein QG656_1886, partial [Candidatus Hydrogenedentes bacterium]|nr:hypothetical protein [Candidatus Hydrogenedentota bacterium]